MDKLFRQGPPSNVCWFINTSSPLFLRSLDVAVERCAGEFIDEHLGLVLGLSTMASAAAGQVVSDFTGAAALGGGRWRIEIKYGMLSSYIYIYIINIYIYVCVL